MTTAKTCQELVAAQEDVRPAEIQHLMQLLLAAQIIVGVNAQGESGENENPDLQSWEFHDLLFHAHSRQGRHDDAVGPTFRLSATLPPLPAVKSVPDENAIPLHRPDLAQLALRDPTLTQCIEQRASIRQFGRQPITAEQLGEFLYRVARVKCKYNFECQTPGGPQQVELTERPYPSGGALYPLEFYPIVCRCAGVDNGLFHYDPLEHRLIPISELTGTLEQILSSASNATGCCREELQVLLVITARFRRVSWKYSALAYSLILKEVGIAMQNMYLAAAAMRLAPCAIGVGDSDRFARAIDSDYYAETSVGEFVLGSQPEMFSEADQPRQQGVPH